MGLGKHLLNGIISLVISVVATELSADDGPYSRLELLLSVAVSAFLSGALTSYFENR